MQRQHRHDNSNPEKVEWFRDIMTLIPTRNNALIQPSDMPPSSTLQQQNK